MKIFLDTEFTGLYQNTTLISISLISENNRSFYAEFNDYNILQADEWIQENVISKLKFKKPPEDEDEYYIKTKFDTNSCNIEMRENKYEIVKELKLWLKQFDKVEIWSDCLSYDWVLFNELFGGAMNLPKNIYYIPFDICTLFKIKGIDPDINREFYAGMMYGECVEDEKDSKHNSLWDAKVIKSCYERLIKED